jgi:hypothetical protein
MGRFADGHVGWRRHRRSNRGNVLLLLLAGGRCHTNSYSVRRIGLSLHVELLQLEVIPNGMEKGQRLGVLDEGLHVVVLLVEHTKKLVLALDTMIHTFCEVDWLYLSHLLLLVLSPLPLQYH